MAIRSGYVARLVVAAVTRRGALPACVLAGALGILGFACAPAGALVTHPYLFSFASGAASTQNYGGIAVDPTSGAIYVGDTEAKTLRKFDAAGDPADFSALGASAISGVEAQALAVDPSDGDIYVAESGHAIERFAASGAPADFSEGPGAGTNLLSGTEAPSGHFGQIAGIAVDSSGDLYVSQNNSPAVVDEFTSTGGYAGLEISTPSLRYPTEVAVDSTGAIYDIENGTLEIVKFDESGSLLGTIATGIAGGEESLAIDTTDDALFVGYANNLSGASGVMQLSSTGANEGEFGAGEVERARAIAVNGANGRVLVQDSAREAVDVFGPKVLVPDVASGASTSTLNEVTVTGSVNTDGTALADAITACHFQYVSDVAFLLTGFDDLSSGGSVPCEAVDGHEIAGPGEIPEDGAGHTVSATISGLPANSGYRFRLVAENVNGPNYGEGVSFTTAGSPEIDAVYVTSVSSSSAVLGAEVDPDLLDTSARFQYVDDETYRADVEAAGAGHGFDHATSVPASAVDLGSGGAPAKVSVQISGLAPDTIYHYRVLVGNEGGSQTSSEPTFTTSISGLGFELPDSRVWEQVTPVLKHHGRVTPPWLGMAQASESGEALTYVTIGPVEEEANSDRIVEQSLAQRGTGGWSSADISPPHETSSPLETTNEYFMFSSDLSRAAIEPSGERAKGPGSLSDEASESTPYLREDFASPIRWRPLVTGREGFSDVCPGTEFGGEEAEQQLRRYRLPVLFVGGSANLQHVALRTQVPLTCDAEGVEGALYEWSAGALQLVSRLPAGEGGEAVVGVLGSGQALGGGSVRRAVSEDGRYVYWGAGEGESGALYVRDTVAGETVRLDVRAPGASGGERGGPLFQSASAGGTYGFFTDKQRLVDDAGNAGADLYVCELVREGSQDKCDLGDLTPETAGESAEVQGMVSAISESGEDVYFVANGVLTGSERNGEGESASPGDCTDSLESPPSASESCNLYIAHHEGSSWGLRFIATLSGADTPDWGVPVNGGGFEGDREVQANTSPSGRYFAFMSQRSLTGYDNHDAASGAADEEVYSYDADADGGEGKLACVSCNPFGARPQGAQEQTGGYQIPSDWTAVWGGRWLAALLPDTETPGATSVEAYQPRDVLDDGRVLFNAFDALVPSDSNGTSDGYEYEPWGLGGCSPTAGGAAIAQAQGDGCVALLSSGTSVHESAVLDSSASGEDIFVYTAASLSPLDEDSDYDIYDARVNGTPAQRTLQAECLGEACQPAVSAPVFGAPSSAVFSGAGNLLEAGKSSRCVQGKAGCAAEKQPKKKRKGKGPKKKRRAKRDKAKKDRAKRDKAKKDRAKRDKAKKGEARGQLQRRAKHDRRAAR
ncbi:MAG TPA: hypothetical protein VGF95_13775 [Solirubrobacteraceae bacterium]